MIFRYILIIELVFSIGFSQSLFGKNITNGCVYNNTFTSYSSSPDNLPTFSPNKGKRSIFDMMYRRGALEIKLAFNLKELIDNRKSNKKQPAVLTIPTQYGGFQNWDITVKPRGVYRRYNCDEMPPLKLNFKKKELVKRGYSQFDDFKLVTHCIEDDGWAAVLLLKEYLAYKYFYILNKNSFRVQLLIINYVDTQTGDLRKHLGILIEDFAELRNRIGANKTKKIFGINTQLISKIDKDYFQTMCLFQYMIGNTDWSIESIRNIKLAEKDGKWLPIPYDFDFSGLVAAPYARVNPDYGLRSIRDRAFLGLEENDYSMEKIKKRFKRKKRKMMRFTRQLKLLPEDQRLDAMYFLESFFKEMENLQYAQPVPSSGK